ncbi:hypothetical protein EDC01DRAFT_635862 [Geopyxis carbonaria]|nr:hypothetical protein EDC01DRAFT_635862 [Geopyxis carbonaria]
MYALTPSRQLNNPSASNRNGHAHLAPPRRLQERRPSMALTPQRPPPETTAARIVSAQKQRKLKSILKRRERVTTPKASKTGTAAYKYSTLTPRPEKEVLCLPHAPPQVELDGWPRLSGGLGYCRLTVPEKLVVKTDWSGVEPVIRTASGGLATRRKTKWETSTGQETTKWETSTGHEIEEDSMWKDLKMKQKEKGKQKGNKLVHARLGKPKRG